MDYLSLDVSQRVAFPRLAKALGESPGRVRVFYLATMPELFASTAKYLASVGLADAQARIVLEKPLGQSLETANQINDQIGSVFDESRVFRIDHYLGKSAGSSLRIARSPVPPNTTMSHARPRCGTGFLLIKYGWVEFVV